jgi:hypothetical protein
LRTCCSVFISDTPLFTDREFIRGLKFIFFLYRSDKQQREDFLEGKFSLPLSKRVLTLGEPKAPGQVLRLCVIAAGK